MDERTADPRETLVACRQHLVRALALLDKFEAQTATGDLVDRVADAAFGAREAVLHARRMLDLVDPQTRVMTAFYELYEAAGWNHPSEVLERPRPSYHLLLRMCEIYVGNARGAERRRLEAMRDKLARAVRIIDDAREQRRKRRQRQAGKPGQRRGTKR